MPRSQQDELITLLVDQMEQHRQQMEVMMALVQDKTRSPMVNTKFNQFDPTSELWSDYWSRFQTFTKANDVPDEKIAEIFLTNQASAVFTLLKNLAAQQTPPKDVNNLTMAEIQLYMEDHYNPKRFVVRERFKFWTMTERKPNETVHELAARIRQEAATCDFPSITDPLDEAMRTRFVCSINNEATVRALFKVKDDELTFNRAIEIASEMEEASKVAKETLGTSESEVLKLGHKNRRMPHKSFSPSQGATNRPKSFQPNVNKRHSTPASFTPASSSKPICFRCDKRHSPDTCRFANTICNFCGIKGHIEAACRKRRRQQKQPVRQIQRVRWNSAQPLTQTCYLNSLPINFEVDTGSRDNFISVKTWNRLNKPKLSPPECQYRCASNNNLPVLGVATISSSQTATGQTQPQMYVVTKLNLNLLGRTTIERLHISVDDLIKAKSVHKVFDKAEHGNADALSRLPSGSDTSFDNKENGADLSTICTIKMIAPRDPREIAIESGKDPVLSAVMNFIQHGWPERDTLVKDKRESWSAQSFSNIQDNLSMSNGCLFYGARVVIPKSMQQQVLRVLHMGHFGMQRMKQLARTAIYWPGIDSDITNMTRNCVSCTEHQNMPPKEPIHPWIIPDKPWTRVHIDHAVNFKGHNWLVLIDAYSKYPCIHQMSSITTKATIRKMEEDFAHFGYPLSIVSDNAQCFSSSEFEQWCKERGIQHIQGAPYHPETNGAAERLVQTFKKSLKKSSLPPIDALQEFLIQYRRTPLDHGFSPSELLNGRQIRARLDTFLPSKNKKNQSQQQTSQKFKRGSSCFALSFKGGRKDKWLPAMITSVVGNRLFDVKVLPDGPTWRRHMDQLRFRHTP